MNEFLQKDKQSLFGNQFEWLRKLRDESFNYFLEHEPLFLKKVFAKIDALPRSATIKSDEAVKLFNKDLLGEYRVQQKSTLLVFINGIYVESFSDKIESNSKIICKPISDAVIEHEEVIKKCFNESLTGKVPLVALNFSLMNAGLFLHIPDNTLIEEPFHFLFLTTDNVRFFANVNNQIVLGKNSKATILEEHVALGKSYAINNIFTNISAAENTNVNYYKLQNKNNFGAQIANLKITPQQNSKINLHYIINGALFSRENIHVDLKEENIFCKVKGLYKADNEEHVEFCTRINHDVPHCASIQMIKGVVEGEAFADFNGRVFVQKNAEKSEAHLTNKNLLLSNKAQIKTSPELEIYADDVNCSHGATCGQLEEHILFYLRTRGIGEMEAKRLLVDAFIEEVAAGFIK